MKENAVRKWIAAAGVSLLCAGVLLLVPAVQHVLVVFGGALIGRTLNHPDIWQNRMAKVSVFFFELSFLLAACQFRNDARVRRVVPLLGVAAVAVLTSTLFSLYPLLHSRTGTDSSVFLYIGRGMHRGLVPYKDMFDHKGLWLYFIEFLGTFSDGYTGMYAIGFAAVFVATLFMYKTSRLFTQSDFTALAVTVIVLFLSGRNVIEGGNLTEDYALPCITFSCYVFLKYVRTRQFSSAGFFFNGFSCGVTLLLRVNMVAPWAFYTLFFLVWLLCKKEYKTLGIMVAWFLAGFAVALVPCAVYLIVTGSASAFWESYILFNFTYISVYGGLGIRWSAAKGFVASLSLACWCMLAALLQRPKDKTVVLNATAFLVTLFFVVLSGRSYPHYAIILLPFLVIPVTVVVCSLADNMRHFSARKVSFVLRCAVLLWFSVTLAGKVGANAYLKPVEDELVQYVMQETPADADVLVLGNNVSYNLRTERSTACRFFYQLPPVREHSEFFDEFKAYVFSGTADCIILPKNRQEQFETDDDLSDVLAFVMQNYDAVSFESGTVFRRR